ncbi:MAG: hypothetical protein WCX30_00160 [Candidatus Paceibacterota bacterium]|jgi:hypothetical protein|nr:hypothetical protein [bacterium]
MENFKNIEQPEKIESMKTPEICVQEEKGVELLSLLFKAKNPEWGECNTPAARNIITYFEDNPISQETLNKIDVLLAEGTDEELLYWLVLTYGHDERLEAVENELKKNKSSMIDITSVKQKLFTALEAFSEEFSGSMLSEKIKEDTEIDILNRQKDIENATSRIRGLIEFFNPDIKTSNIKKIIFMPTNPIFKTNTGFSCNFSGEQFILSHIDNTDNQDHEFLHGIINPIVEKLSQKLTEEQKEKISKLVSGKLRRDYGEEYFSLLCEEFIRTYNDYFKKGEKPQSYENFIGNILKISEEEFQMFLNENNKLKEECKKSGVKNIEEFKNKLEEDFRKTREDKLQELIYKMYQEYSEKEDKENINFEKFILDRFPKEI